MSSIKFEQTDSGFIVRSSLASDCEVIVRLVRQFQPGIWDELEVDQTENPQVPLPWSVTIGELGLWTLLAEWIRAHHASDTGWMWMRDSNGLFFSVAGGIVYRP